MAYTALDLLDKIIYVEEKKKSMCGIRLEKIKNNTRIYVLVKVLIKNINENIEFNKKLRKEIEKTEMEEIDFVVYDKISFLIDEFSNKIVAPDVFNIKDIFKSCLEFQKDILALYIYIQGKVVQKQADVGTSTYKVLNTMIAKKKKELKELEDFEKKYC
ncbi:hypothetical protein [Clostridium cochlearium]|uniref:Uncharacterized protein n=1 Tax=Clostridium cochlearium TaxID=1494 RepID=A0A2X2W3T7_CLOCO|nr:hypothetical protein [Clostridium cochlearium]MBE6064693.1 hypothetical protein [Clostridium cochlearium]MBU5268357.1 hypothetical protein [Clostridium cochlearium]SQB35518.1 Uncharacterised protein [Clostridium cochlearium]